MTLDKNLLPSQRALSKKCNMLFKNRRHFDVLKLKEALVYVYSDMVSVDLGRAYCNVRFVFEAKDEVDKAKYGGGQKA